MHGIKRMNNEALETIKRFKEEFPGYFKGLHSKCQKCRYIASSTCEMCEGHDMYMKVDGLE